MNRTVFGAIVVVNVILGAVLTFSPAASAQEGGSLIIRASQCPDGYEGQDFAVDCVDPAAGVEFFTGTPNSGNMASTVSGGDGLATFSLAQFDLDPTGPDTVVVGEPAAQTGDFAVTCAKNAGEALDFVTENVPAEPDGPLLGIRFEFETGDDIACEWYRLSLPAPGEAQAPGEDDAVGVAAAELPNTGVGAGGAQAVHGERESAVWAGLIARAVGAMYGVRRRGLI